MLVEIVVDNENNEDSEKSAMTVFKIRTEEENNEVEIKRLKILSQHLYNIHGYLMLKS